MVRYGVELYCKTSKTKTKLENEVCNIFGVKSIANNTFMCADGRKFFVYPDELTHSGKMIKKNLQTLLTMNCHRLIIVRHATTGDFHFGKIKPNASTSKGSLPRLRIYPGDIVF